MESKRRRFQIAGKNAPFRLFPVPVIKNRKFLIECERIEEARLLRFFLQESWLSIDSRNVEGENALWVELSLHEDGQTKRFRANWEKLQLHYLPKRGPTSKVLPIERTLSRAVQSWALSSDGERATKLQELQSRIKAQQNCSSCQSLGIKSVDFETMLSSFHL